MRNLNLFSRKPLGQALLATVLFVFIFMAVFAGLYRAGIAYGLKEKARRGVDLTVLSAGASYANGLQWVRYTNAMVMVMATLDIAIMVWAAIDELGPFLALFVSTAVSIAKRADPHTRDIVQMFQQYLFGIDLPRGVPGIYPLMIELDARSLAGENRLKTVLPWPLVLFNMESAKSGRNSLFPDMALRFRYADELIPPRPRALYSLNHNGQTYYFTEDQVESGHNPRHPKEKRVRRDLDSPFAGMWVRKVSDGSRPNELGHIAGFVGTFILDILHDLLKSIKLDVTHRDDPPNHTLVLMDLLPGIVSSQKVDIPHLSESVLEGGGLAAWDIGSPRFQTHLEKVELSDLPGVPGMDFRRLAGFSGLSPHSGVGAVTP